MQYVKPTQQPVTAAFYSAIILAGGKSSRMGQDKALLTLGGETQLSRTVALAKAAGCDQILISRNQSGFIYDIYPDCGPLSGIQAALLHVRASSCLVLTIDTPLLNAQLINQLLLHRCACFSGSPLPAVIPNNTEVKQWLATQLQQQQRLSVAALLQQFSAVELSCSNPQALLNTNTPAQWQQAQTCFLQNAQSADPAQDNIVQEHSRYGQNC